MEKDEIIRLVGEVMKQRAKEAIYSGMAFADALPAMLPVESDGKPCGLVLYCFEYGSASKLKNEIKHRLADQKCAIIYDINTPEKVGLLIRGAIKSLMSDICRTAIGTTRFFNRAQINGHSIFESWETVTRELFIEFRKIKEHYAQFAYESIKTDEIKQVFGLFMSDMKKSIIYVTNRKYNKIFTKKEAEYLPEFWILGIDGEARFMREIEQARASYTCVILQDADN